LLDADVLSRHVAREPAEVGVGRWHILNSYLDRAATAAGTSGGVSMAAGEAAACRDQRGGGGPGGGREMNVWAQLTSLSTSEFWDDEKMKATLLSPATCSTDEARPTEKLGGEGVIVVLEI
jgi:hypothetical protein